MLIVIIFHLLQVNNICADCHPKYPIIRKPLHSKVFYSLSGKKHTTVEQKLQNQQYQIFAMWISVNTSKFWLLKCRKKTDFLNPQKEIC